MPPEPAHQVQAKPEASVILSPSPIVRMTVRICLPFWRWMSCLPCDSLCHVEDNLHGTVLCFAHIMWQSENSWFGSPLAESTSVFEMRTETTVFNGVDPCRALCVSTHLLYCSSPFFQVPFSYISLSFSSLLSMLHYTWGSLLIKKRCYVSVGWHWFELGPLMGTKW